MAGRDRDWVRLRGVSFPCVVGVFAREQTKAQALEIDVEMNLDLEAAAAGDLERTVDYARLLEEVCFIAREGRWGLLESMATALARHVLSQRTLEDAAVGMVVVRLRKPEVFSGAAVPEVEVRRDRIWAVATTVSREFERGHVTVLQETAKTGAYRLGFTSPGEWRVPHGMALHVAAGEVATAGGIVSAGGSVPGGVETVTVRSELCTLIAVSRPPASFRPG